MSKAINFLRTAINIVLCLGLFLVLNEGESFTPNFIGLGCFIALIILNRKKYD